VLSTDWALGAFAVIAVLAGGFVWQRRVAQI
jgi:hypothetical protein